MIGVYFSGTGNTKFCMKEFLKAYGEKVEMYPLEDQAAAVRMKENKEIVLGYPVQYSNLPKIVHDFIVNNSSLWKGKKVFLIATMGLFSGDGTGVAARLLKRYGAEIMGGLHVGMPDSIADVKALKRPLEKNKLRVQKAVQKVHCSAEKLKEGRPGKEGLSLISHMMGLLCQRLYFYNKTKDYTDQLKIDPEKCIGCGKCIGLCPMQNITMQQGKASAQNKCTMCYRCISHCPKQAIKLLGKKVVEQSRIEKYL